MGGNRLDAGQWRGHDETGNLPRRRDLPTFLAAQLPPHGCGSARRFTF